MNKAGLKIPLPMLRWLWLGLIAMQLLWFGWWAPPSTMPAWLAVALMALPLLVMLIPVWRLGIRAPC
ncbi:MAG: hypothetical protein LC637_08890 [Xanthomonadaceae bacterium]|nr:hypothetical protein [Xanthomonadaceae bacterium]